MTLKIEDLRDSNEFLNLLLDNMDTAVLIADENLKIHEFNDSFLSLFDRSYDSVVDITFGPASGGVNAVKENKTCGERIILYTDGLIDNFGPKDDYNGKENFYNSLRRLSEHPVDQIVNAVMAESKKMRAGAIPDDDMSLLLIEYTG
jgi:hypothetical protein